MRPLFLLLSLHFFLQIQKKCKRYRFISFIWLYPKIQACKADSNKHRYISKPFGVCWLAVRGSTSHIIERERKTIRYQHISLSPSSPEGSWFEWHISIVAPSCYWKNPHTLTIFHLWLMLQFPPHSPHWSLPFSLAISLKCLKKIVLLPDAYYSCFSSISGSGFPLIFRYLSHLEMTLITSLTMIDHTDSKYTMWLNYSKHFHIYCLWWHMLFNSCHSVSWMFCETFLFLVYLTLEDKTEMRIVPSLFFL